MTKSGSDITDSKTLSTDQDRGSQREIRLNNILTRINTVFILVLLAFPIIRNEPIFLIDIAITTTLGVGVLLLNKIGKYHYAKFIANVFFLPLHFFAILFAGELLPFIYEIYTYAIFAYLIYPIFTLNYTKEKGVFILAMAINLSLLIIHEIAFSTYKADYQFDDRWFVIIKAFQVVTWLMISTIAFTSKMINIKSEAKLQKINQELNKLNVENTENLKEIAAQNEEIVAQNEELSSQQEQLSAKNIYIEEQNRKLKEFQEQLEQQLKEITSAKTEIENKEAVNQSILSALRQNFHTTEYDPQGNILHISPMISDNLEIDSESLVNKNVSETFDQYMIYPKNWDFKKDWRRILSGELKNQNFIFKFGEHEIHVHSHYAPIPDASGETTMVLSVSQDITDLVNQRKEIEKTNEILNIQKEEINAINNSLEKRIKERTIELEKRNAQLTEYAFINSHILRAPVSSILGLINLFRYENLSKSENELFEHLLSATNNLNEVVVQINTAIEENAEMTRNHFKKR